MKTILSSSALLLLLLPTALRAQLISEQFATLPTTWTQLPAASWTLSPNLGVGGSSCPITEDVSMTTPTLSYQTPTVSIAGIVSYTIAFKVATVKNNFVAPNVSVYYDAGAGPQFVARWGSGFSSNTTYTIDDSFTPAPVTQQDVNWQSCTHTLSAISGTAVSFRFDAELVNAGYVLLDSVVIKGKPGVFVGLAEQTNAGALNVYPNPSASKKISLEGKDIRTLLLVNNLGQQQPVSFKHTAAGADTDLSHLPAGLYYLTVTTSTSSLTRKIVLE